jgi:hypothetical protein
VLGEEPIDRANFAPGEKIKIFFWALKYEPHEHIRPSWNRATPQNQEAKSNAARHE